MTERSINATTPKDPTMSDADRAAKAARAKALLKKRQREKAGPSGGVATLSGTSVSSPISTSRALSPQPQESQEEDRRDIGDVFNDTSDISWLSSLPRAPSPPLRTSSPHLSSESISVIAPHSATVTSLSAAVSPPIIPQQNDDKPLLQQINSLQAENISLSSKVKQLQDFETKVYRAETLLVEERARLNARVADLESSLSSHVTYLHKTQSKIQETEALLEEQRAQAKELKEQLQRLELEKQQVLQNERETISLLVSEKSSLTAEVARLGVFESRTQTLEDSLKEERRKMAALEDQIQNIHAEQEETAKAIQVSQANEKQLSERCRETERELHLTASSMKDLKQDMEQHQRRVLELEEQIQSDDRVERLENSLKNTQDRADELEYQMSKLKQAYAAVKTERDEIDSQRQVHSSIASELETKLSELQVVHTGILEQLAAVSSEKSALAEEKSELQAQVDSARKVIAELEGRLTQVAATITSNSRQLQTVQNQLRTATRRAEDAEKTQRDLQAEGTNLMRSLDEMRPKIIELTSVKLELTEAVTSLEGNLRKSQDTIMHLESKLRVALDEKESVQKQFRERLLQHEKEQSQAMANSSDLQKAYADLQKELEASSTNLRNLEAEWAHYHEEKASHLEEIEALKSSLQANAEEISNLQEQLASTHHARDEAQEFLEHAQNELEALRNDLVAREDEISHLREAVSPSRSGPQSLDDELLSSLRQQHSLDLSAAHSQIRALENSVFEANARAHALQKQISALEGQVAHPRPSSRLGQRSFSPAPSSLRPASRNSELRQSSISSHRPPLSRSIFDQNMSVETRHKRLISLSMLKARIDSEVQVIVSRPSSRASSMRALSSVRSLQNSPPGSPHSRSDSNSRVGHMGHRPQFLDDSHVFWCHACSGDLVVL